MQELIEQYGDVLETIVGGVGIFGLLALCGRQYQSVIEAFFESICFR